MNGDKTLFIGGHIEYRDIFPDSPLHHYDWCDLVLPDDISRNVISFVALRVNAN